MKKKIDYLPIFYEYLQTLKKQTKEIKSNRSIFDEMI